MNKVRIAQNFGDTINVLLLGKYMTTFKNISNLKWTI